MINMSVFVKRVILAIKCRIVFLKVCISNDVLQHKKCFDTSYMQFFWEIKTMAEKYCNYSHDTPYRLIA